MKFGCCAPTGEYELVRRMGYDYIEFAAREINALSREQFDELLWRYDAGALPCLGFNSYCGSDLSIVGPDYDKSAAKKYAEHVLKRGDMLGIRTVGIGAPLARILPEGFPYAEADKQMEEFLAVTCEAAARYGQLVLLEAVHDKFCDYMTVTGEAFAMVERLKIKNLKLVIDFYNAAVMGETPEDLKKYLPYAEHLHISTDLGGNKRGFLSEEDLPMLEACVSAAKSCGYDNTLSVEADAAYLKAGGAKNMELFNRYR